MLRSVAVLLCLATSQGLRVQVPTDNSKDVSNSPRAFALRHQVITSSFDDLTSILAAAAWDGSTSPDVVDADKAELSKAKPQAKPKGPQMEKEEVKAGDGKTFVANGDKVKMRTTGIIKQPHFHDSQVDIIQEFEYPAPSFPGMAGQPNLMELVKDTKVLPGMSLGAIHKVSIQDKKEVQVYQVELLQVIKKGSPEEASYIEEKKNPPKESFIRSLPTKKMEGQVTLDRKVIKEGDGKTFAKKGDKVALRITATMTEKGKDIYMNLLQTSEYPALENPYKMQLGALQIPVKSSFDQELAPDMSLGEIHQLTFAPIKMMGKVYKIPPFNVEMMKIN